jgi:hypothetical protein
MCGETFTTINIFVIVRIVHYIITIIGMNLMNIKT